MLTDKKLLRLYAVALLVALAIGQQWLARQRPAGFDEQAQSEFLVVNPADAGPGTLREAIFNADRSGKRTRIVLQVKRINIATPLPALINPKGILLESKEEPSVLDAHLLPAGAVLQIDSPQTLLRNLRVEGAADTAVLILKPQVRLEKIAIANSGNGVVVAAAVAGTQILDSHFDGNRDALRLEAPGSGTQVLRNVFKNNSNSGVWIVRSDAAGSGSDQHRVTDNRFEANGLAIVIGNDNALIERNTLVAQRRESILLINSNSTVNGNRLSNNTGTAISVSEGRATQLTANEIDNNKGLGILVRNGRAVIENNRLYKNGSGIVSLFGVAADPSIIRGNLLMEHSDDALVVIGGSPLVQNNRILRTRKAGLRLLDYQDGGTLSKAAPLLQGNVLQDNLVNEPQHGMYRAGAAT